ncbi:hypothetical protein [uncultured Legionella sp.]|uniref:hypothetical protein n=1 Tax=uncultured Legionella sp. TaxID=210934 RepID=UPI00260688FB|nr:hypothetical protein [uncultured Legionella sp.]
MGKEKREHLASYRPMPHKSRFWLHSEHCYTEEDLMFREWILKIRTNSGIHSDYLANPNSWFAEDSQALINIYEHAWIYSDAFKPRDVLTRDDFHVQPIDSQRLQWPAFYDLMQNVGDYLLLRNQELPPEHLNQPMNFVFLDVNNILKGLSQNTNIQQVQEQLERLTQYLRTLEKNISPLVGSDRLFLANFRTAIDTKIAPQLTHLFESQLLRDRLGELSKTIKKLSTDRNRILHFALSINPVNPHPYDFSIGQLEDSTAYPTQAAKDCGKPNTELMTTPDSIPVLQLTMEQLKKCPHFELISMDEEILAHYAGAISDLNELERFQQVVAQIMDLLGQAGEVYTIHQFKEQMLILLQQIDVFVGESSKHISSILSANNDAYHKAIQEEQNLSFWKKFFSNEKKKLNSFIKNQDTLAQFPTSNTELLKTNKALKSHVGEVINHLNQPRLKESSFETISGKVHDLDNLMGSMHQWIEIQHIKKGLAPPSAPKSLKNSPAPAVVSVKSTSNNKPVSHYPPLFNPTSSTQIEPTCSVNNTPCSINSVPSAASQNTMLYMGLITLVPLGIIALVLLYTWSMSNDNEKEHSSPSVYGTGQEFNEIKEQVDDLFTKIKIFEHTSNHDLSDDYDLYLEKYNRLILKAKSGNAFKISGLNKLLENLDYFYEEMCTESENENSDEHSSIPHM